MAKCGGLLTSNAEREAYGYSSRERVNLYPLYPWAVPPKVRTRSRLSLGHRNLFRLHQRRIYDVVPSRGEADDDVVNKGEIRQSRNIGMACHPLLSMALPSESQRKTRARFPQC